MKTVIAAAGIDPKEKRFPKAEVVADIFSMAINTNRAISHIVDTKYPYFLDQVEQLNAVHARYEAKKKSTNAMDFDDLLEKALKLLNEHEDIAEHLPEAVPVRARGRVPGHQPHPGRVRGPARRETPEHHGRRRRRADPSTPGAGRTCRTSSSSPAATRPRARTRSRRTTAPSPRSSASPTPPSRPTNSSSPKTSRRRARRVRSSPRSSNSTTATSRASSSPSASSNSATRACELDEIAVLYRAHFHALELQIELTRHGVPFAITSGLRFFEQAHIKDVAAFLKFRLQPPRRGGLQAHRAAAARHRRRGGGQDLGALRANPARARNGRFLHRRLRRGQGRGQEREDVETVRPHAGRNRPRAATSSRRRAPSRASSRPSTTTTRKTKFPNYEARREELNVLANYARQYSDPAEFLSQLALVTALETEAAINTGSEERDTERVTLSSVHQAKGLEWRVVFVINLTEGSFPGNRSLESPAAIEEERRLFYVAVTRPATSFT